MEIEFRVTIFVAVRASLTGLQHVVDRTGLQHVVGRTGLQHVVDRTGLQHVVDRTAARSLGRRRDQVVS